MSNYNTDDFARLLEDKTALLQQCQQDKNQSSCLKCENLIGCEIRNAYVQAVYDSMSKGNQGDFDFN